MNRVRGDGGRFYSTEELQEQMMAAQQAGDGSGSLMGANVFKLEKEGEQVGAFLHVVAQTFHGGRPPNFQKMSPSVTLLLVLSFDFTCTIF